MMPDGYEPGSTKMSYLRTLGWGLFFTLNLQVIYFVLFYLSDYRIGYISNVVCFSMAVAAILSLKYTRHSWLASNLIAAIIFSNVITNSYFTGGLHSSILLWVLILPIISIFVLERKYGVYWVLATLIALFGFFLFAPNGAPDSITLIENADFDIWVNIFILTAIIWFSSLVIDNAKNRAIAEAGEAIKEADKNATALEAELNQRQLAELALRESEERLSLAIKGADMGLWDWDIESGEMTMNAKFEEILGYDTGEVEKTYTYWIDLLHPEDRPEVKRGIKNHIDGYSSMFRSEHRVRQQDGGWIWVYASGIVSHRNEKGNADRMVGIQFEITDRKLFEERLQHLANTDGLTDLINRRRFFELAENELERANRYDLPLSIALIDIDNFKEINDQYGHLVGDQALLRVAKICSEMIRGMDILARYGGEEFVILFPHTENQEAFTSADRIRRTIEDQVLKIEEKEINLTLSVGVASMLKDETDNIDILLDWADQALYQSKRLGKNKTTVWER
jgi:diguanylate cyclase (GGDEF)-like protein/PAS domain S-box-containing protein